MVRLLGVFLALIVTGGCSQVQVSQDYDTAFGFQKFHSFSWQETDLQPSADIRENNPLLYNRINRAVTQVLQEKGYVPDEQADFLVTVNYSITTKIESSPFTTSIGFGMGSRHRYGGVGIGNAAEIDQYDVGVLTIDMYDSQSGQLVWRGTGSEMVSMHSSPKQNSEMVQRMVRAVLGQFPP